MHWDFDLGSTTIWVFFALLIIIAFLMFKGIHKMIGKALDDRADGIRENLDEAKRLREDCLLYTSPSPRDRQKSRMPSSA